MKKYSIPALLLALLLVCVSCAPLTGGDETTKADVTTDDVTTGEVTTEEITTEEVTTEEVTTEELTTEALTTEEQTPTVSSKYLSLGDSIANGYGLADQANTRYSALLAKKLGIDDVHSAALDGQTSSELLAHLETNSYSGNELITVSIGANNILRPATDALMGLLISPENALANLYSPEFNAKLQAGVAQFGEDLPKIVDALQESNPGAKIVLLSIYNPFKGGKVPLTINGGLTEVDLGAMTANYVNLLNAIVASVAQQKGCIVADVYTAFESSSEQNVNVVLDANGYISFTAFDPHPNAPGHILIAEVIEAALPKAE